MVDESRSGKREEMTAMEKILVKIRENKDFKAKVKDIQYFDKDDILSNYKNGEISNAFKYLKEKYTLGTQYEWFALLADAQNWKIECGLEMSDRSKALKAITLEGRLVLIEDDFLQNRYCIEQKISSKELNLVLGNIILGIVDLTKKDAEVIASQKGWMDIMKVTWFCHTPIKGKPCGMCNPCKDAMNEEMEWRMPSISQWRYKYLKDNFEGKVYRKLFSVFQRIKT